MEEGSKWLKAGIVFFSFVLVAQVSTGDLRASPVRTTLNDDGLEAEIRIDGSEYSLIEQNGYTYILGDDLFYPSTSRVPALPFKVINLAIPPDLEPSEVQCEIIKERLLGRFLISPVQPPSVLSKPDAQWVDGSEEIYGANSFYPAKAIGKISTGFMGETKVLAVTLVPFRWNPQTKELRAIEELRLAVRFQSPSNNRDLRRLNPTPVAISRACRKVVVNPEDIERFTGGIQGSGLERQEAIFDKDLAFSNLPQGTYEYVIVTTGSLVSAFEPLVDWKITKGLTATCVTVEWIDANYDGEDTQAKIRNFIKDAYQNWGTNWVLLGGDTNIIPSRTVYAMDCEMGGVAGNRIRCDLYFADLDGTWNANGVSPYGEVSDSVDMYPEVFVGRAPAENYLEAQVFVEKVITYEKNPPFDYALDMLMLGEILWTNPYTDAGIGLDMIDEDYIPPRFDPITKLYESRGNESRESVLAAMSEGKNFVFHDGHCSEYVMGVGQGYIYYTDADTLSNGSRLLVINSIGCWPAAIDKDCIAEHFINNPDGGAVAFIGNSRYGWGSPGNPGLGYSDKFQHEFARAVFEDSLLHIGEALASSKMVFVPLAQDENVYRWNEYQLNLLGDPEMALWTEEPRAMSLNLPAATISGGILRAEVRDSQGAVASATVTVTNGDDYYETGLTDFSGCVVFEVVTSSPESLLVTATSLNYRSVAAKVALIQEGPLPSWTTLKVVDSNDSLANPAETVVLKIALKNFGTQTIEDVNAFLRSLGNCTVLDSISYYGDLEPGMEVFGESDFRIAVDSTLANGETIELELNLADGNSNRWVLTIPVVVATPFFEVTSHGINDVVWGDGDFVVEPGEDIDLTVEITNAGLTAGDAVVSLRSLDCYIEIVDSLGSAGVIESGSTGYSKHRISVSSQCPSVHIAALEITIGQAEFSSLDTIYLAIGELSYFDDFSSGEGLWEYFGTPDSWFLTSNRFHSDSLSWYFGNPSTYRYSNNSSGSLISPPLIAGEECRLSFWFWYDFTTYGTDGIYVVLHRNSSLDTLDFIGSGGALDNSGEALNVSSRWVKWEKALENVMPGDTLRVEFKFVSDGSGTAEGIYIDDFTVSCKAPVIAGIKDGLKGGAQSEFDVFPNPSTRMVEIVFANRVGEHGISIYSAEGRLVKRIRKSSSEERLVWNLDDEHGQRVASGVYFISADGAGRKSGFLTKKVVITR